jgi:hypothetical protein
MSSVARLSFFTLRVLALCCALTSLVFAQTAPKPLARPKTPTVSVETHRAQLQRAIEKLKQIEERPPRDIAPVLKSLSQTQTVKRKDGQTQTASGDQWDRWGEEAASTPLGLPPTAPKPPVPITPPAASKNASREETQKLREAVEVRLRALDEWDASTYEPASAQESVRQLEGSGQIRTGPTWLQQFTSDVNKWVKSTFLKFVQWIAGLFPSGTPGKLPVVNPDAVKAVFFATVLALLAILVFLVWRAIGGRLGKRGAKRGVLAEGEDAELLLLPPDELRVRASQFAREGNFREALRHLYISLLLVLDARGVWRYDARRTNWEHIAALRADKSQANLVSPLSNITRVFDRVRYGNAAFGLEDWTRFESEISRVESQTPAP